MLLYTQLAEKQGAGGGYHRFGHAFCDGRGGRKIN